MMKLILIENIPSLGHAGDVIEVADGYARNYLVPKKKAVLATPNNVKALEHQRQVLEKRKERERQKAKNLAEKIEGLICEIKKQAGEEEKIFGSVTSADIAMTLEEKGIVVDKKKIVLDEPIKQVGDYEVLIKLYPEMQAYLKVRVIKE
jgi:large subunit ribosomal protein L9